MDIFFFILFLFIVIIPIVLMHHIPIHKNHIQATNGVINYDSFMRKFVYKVSFTEKEIIDKLTIPNAIDELQCNFDFEKNTVIFSEYGSHMAYYFQIVKCNSFSILRLEQTSLIGMKSSVPYKLNPFLINKLQAQIIPFSKYGF